MPNRVIRSPIRSPFKRALRAPFDYAGAVAAFVAPATATIAHFGDSKTQGANAPAGEDYPAQLLGMIQTGATTWTKFNYGAGGQRAATTASTIGANCVTAFSGQAGPKIAFVRIGINDILDGTAAATIKTQIDLCVTNAVANGATKVYVFTIDESSFFTGAQSTQCATLNASLLASYPTTAISPRDLDARFAYNGSNDVWDGLHEFSYGYNCVARFCANKLVADGYIAAGAFNYATAPTFGTTAGTYATWQSTTVTSAGSSNIYVTLDGTAPSLHATPKYLRAVPVISSRTVRAEVNAASKYPIEGTATYTITTAFSPTADRLYNKGGASGSSWTDASGNGRTLTLFNSPTISAGVVTFNGTTQYGKAAARTLAQPFSVLAKFRKTASTTDKYVFDGDTSLKALGRIRTVTEIDMYAGSAAAAISPGFAVGTPVVAGWIFNGASSSSQLNLAAPVTGNPGANSITGFTLAANGNASGNFVDGDFWGAMVVASALTQAQMDAHIQWATETWA